MDTAVDSYRYRAYGLQIRSALPLPELPQNGERGADLEIRLGEIEHRRSTTTPGGTDFWAEEDRACHLVPGVGAFLVTAGREILVERRPEAAPELINLSILGPALALALHQRGIFVFHASSVVVGGAGVAFLGGFASGKSTLAASFRRLGHRFASDDVTAVDLARQVPRIVPSFAQLKLWPDAARSLGFSPSELPKLHPEHGKRALRFARDFDPAPVPLRRLYVLAIGDSVAVEKLPAVESFEEILRHWYGGRFGPDFVDAIDLRGHFLRASRLAREVPVRRLERPPTLKEDPQLSQVIEREILRDLEEELSQP